MPLFRKRPQRFRKDFEFPNLQRWLAGLRQKTFAFHPNEIAEVEQLEKIDRLRANFFRMDVNLNPAGGVAQIDKVTFAHVAMRGNASRRAQSFAFFEFFPDRRNIAAGLERRAKRLDSALAQRFPIFRAAARSAHSRRPFAMDASVIGNCPKNSPTTTD